MRARLTMPPGAPLRTPCCSGPTVVDTAVTANSASITVTHPTQSPQSGWLKLEVEYCEWDGTNAASMTNCQTTTQFNAANAGTANPAPQTTTSSLTNLKPSQNYRQRAKAYRVLAPDNIVSDWGPYDAFTTTAYT